MSVHRFGKPAAQPRRKQEVTLTGRAPAFRADDLVLERVWRIMEAKCAEAGEPSGDLMVYETAGGFGWGTRERREYTYVCVEDLRRSSDGPGLLREYTLSVSSPWGDDYRRVRLTADRFGAARITAIAPDAEWCREVVDAVVCALRPSRVWYSSLHRIGMPGLVVLTFSLALVTLLVSQLEPTLGPNAVAAYWIGLVAVLSLMIWGGRFFPPADIRVERRSADIAVPDWPSAAGDTDASSKASDT